MHGAPIPASRLYRLQSVNDVFTLLLTLFSSLQITRHLSPFVQKPVGPWLKTFPKKVRPKSGPHHVPCPQGVNNVANSCAYFRSILQMMDRAPYYIVYPFGTFAAVYLAICWTDAEDAKEDYEHRF